MTDNETPDERAIDFKRRVRNNGPKLKDFPNVNAGDGVFSVQDYVSKDVSSWAMVPEVDEDEEEEFVRSVAEDMYEIYERVGELFDEVTVERSDEDMYWVSMEVEVPESPSRRERLAEEVGEALMRRVAS